MKKKMVTFLPFHISHNTRFAMPLYKFIMKISVRKDFPFLRYP